MPRLQIFNTISILRMSFFRYKIISANTWPNFRGSDRDGVEQLLRDVGLSQDVSYGKTKIFIRTPQSITLLEEKRTERIPVIVHLLQRVRHCFLLRNKKRLSLHTVLCCLVFLY